MTVLLDPNVSASEEQLDSAAAVEAQRLVLSAVEFDALVEWLAKPAQPNEGLRRLMQLKPVWEEAGYPIAIG